jgi:hypothetical protein
MVMTKLGKPPPDEDAHVAMAAYRPRSVNRGSWIPSSLPGWPSFSGATRISTMAMSTSSSYKTKLGLQR